MKVKLLNDGCYSSAGNVKFPVEVEASECKDAEGVDVTFSELIRVGFDLEPDDDTLYFTDDEIERLPDTTWHFATGDKDVLNSEASERHYCISERCCNQFGERDEIQTIINSLQADVVARGNRITELEDLLAEITFMLQSDVPTKVADVLAMLLGDVDD